nr:ribonuclease H-like domain, reverse transcriptase, RNA-dependent DNA polymerase [Tanacetum cinerariifolium]
MARLQFCDYHNMVPILEKGEFNTDFHPMVDFIVASPLRYALTVRPTIFVSDIQHFWSTARIETTDEGIHILATVDGIQRTVSESSLRRNLKLRDEDGIVSIPDTELFENLTLMGYNISQNQKLTFQKGQFSHQWKYLIHTIMQCLSPKSTGFKEFRSNIATTLICLATNKTYNYSKMIFDGMVKNVNNKVSKFLMYPRIVPFFDTMLVHQGEGSGTPSEPHHTPFPESSALPPVANEPASPMRDVSKGEACPTESGFIPDQDRATIVKSSTLPHDSAPRVTSLTANEGSIQHNISELMALCTSLQRQYSELQAQFQAQEEEIVKLKDMVKVLEDREGVAAKQSGDDAPIKGRSINEGEAAAERINEPASHVRDVSKGEACLTEFGFIANQDRETIAKSSTLPHDLARRVTSPAADEGTAERISNDSEEIARVLTSMDATTVLARGIDVPTAVVPFPLLVPLLLLLEMQKWQGFMQRKSFVGNKMHKTFPLLGESSHWKYKFPLPVEDVPTTRRMEIPLPGVCTAMMKKLTVKEKWQLH